MNEARKTEVLKLLDDLSNQEQRFIRELIRNTIEVVAECYRDTDIFDHNGNSIYYEIKELADTFGKKQFVNHVS